MGKVFGADVAGSVSQEEWATLIAKHGVRFGIVRCYRNKGSGIPDEDCPTTVANALTAGIADLGVYHFPVVRSKAPEQQARESLQFLRDHGIAFNCLWLDVEEGGTSWSSTATDNVDFISRFVATCKADAASVGIYCGTDGWKKISGDTHQFSTLPLWWSSHGSTFTSFGGWTDPAVVQFRYEQPSGEIKYDADYKLM